MTDRKPPALKKNGQPRKQWTPTLTMTPEQESLMWEAVRSYSPHPVTAAQLMWKLHELCQRAGIPTPSGRLVSRTMMQSRYSRKLSWVYAPTDEPAVRLYDVPKLKLDKPE